MHILYVRVYMKYLCAGISVDIHTRMCMCGVYIYVHTCTYVYWCTYAQAHGPNGIKHIQAHACMRVCVSTHILGCMRRCIHAYRWSGSAPGWGLSLPMYIYISLAPSLDLRIYVNKYGRECVYVCVSYVYVPVYTGVYRYICIYMYGSRVYVYIRVCINTHIRACTRRCMHAYRWSGTDTGQSLSLPRYIYVEVCI